MKRDENIKLCVGILTYCPPENPERLEVLKKCVASMAVLKNSQENIRIHVWDNNSCEEAKLFLKSNSFIDSFYFSSGNYYDYGAMHFLAEKAKSIGAEYVMHVEDDNFFYDDNFLDDSFEFLNNNVDVGTLRVLKYDFDNKHLYDKFDAKLRGAGNANAQRHFNQITRDPLEWSEPCLVGKKVFYKNNWHWYNFPSLCKTTLLEEILPKKDHKPLIEFEGYLMKEYHRIATANNLKTAVLNLGAVEHLDIKTSMRIKQDKNSESNTRSVKPVIWKQLSIEIKKHLNEEN
tara:strand:- start:7878 stop:8744 length:867 start_codon:yes stop_codon:yes gene_type:complete